MRNEKFTPLLVTIPEWMEYYLREVVVPDGDYPSVDACIADLIEKFRDRREDERYEQWLMGDLKDRFPEATEKEWTAFSAAFGKTARRASAKNLAEALAQSERGAVVELEVSKGPHRVQLTRRAIQDIKEAINYEMNPPSEEEKREELRQAFHRWKERRTLE